MFLIVFWSRFSFVAVEGPLYSNRLRREKCRRKGWSAIFLSFWSGAEGKVGWNAIVFQTLFMFRVDRFEPELRFLFLSLIHDSLQAALKNLGETYRAHLGS